MSRLLSLMLVCGVMLTAGAYAQSSVAGAWDLSINGPEGAITAVATLKQDGEKVTGSIESPQGTAELNGTIKGKALNVSFTIAGPNGQPRYQGEWRSRRRLDERHHRLRDGHGGFHRQEKVSATSSR